MPSSSESLVVIGAGGHGRETISLLREAQARGSDQWQLRGVVADQAPDPDLLAQLDVEWLGPVEVLRDIRAPFSVAIGDSATRRQLQTRWRKERLHAATLVHWSASIGLDVELGQGCFVGALTALTTHILLGEGVQVNAGCILSHDVEIGDFATLAPGVRVTGGVVVEPGATIFTGASVLPGVRIGRDSVVGAGATVVCDVAPGSTVVGVPARPIGERSTRDIR